MWPHVLIGDLAVGIRDLVRGATTPHERLRKRIATALLVTLLIDAVATGLMYWLEHGAKRSDISSVFQAFFWVTAQLLTVSSQLQNPVTTGGRVVDLVLEVWSITVVATLAGSIAAFFHASDGERRATSASGS
jgi:hypothetical protein